MISHLPIIIIIFPLAIAFMILLFRKYSPFLSIVGLLVSFLSLVRFLPFMLKGEEILYHLGGWQGPLGISLSIDGLSFFFSFTVLLVGIMVILYSIPEKKYNHNYYFLLLVLLSSMIGTIFTADIFNMYILFELVSIVTCLLVAYYQQGIALRASFNYLLISTVALSLFLLGVGSLYSMAGSLYIPNIFAQMPIIFTYKPGIVLTSLSLFITSMGIKMAMVPVHGWLPDAHSLAPSSVSAILSGVVVKVGVYCMIRLLYGLFNIENFHFFKSSLQLLMILGAITIVFGAMMALAQYDLKRMLAYSTIVQIGVILIGIGLHNNTGLEGALFHVINHALLKSGLFFCAGIVISQTGKRRIIDMAGYAERNPLLVFCFTILSLGIIGIPPMNGFISKFMICLSAVETGYSIFALIIIFGSLLTAAYFFRVIQVFYSKPIQQDTRLENSKHNKDTVLNSGFFRVFAICFLASLSLLLGIIPSLGILIIRPAIGILVPVVLP